MNSDVPCMIHTHLLLGDMFSSFTICPCNVNKKTCAKQMNSK